MTVENSAVGNTCNLCGNTDFVPLIEREGMIVVRCETCGLAFTHPQPEETANQYGEDYFGLYARRSEFRKRRMTRRLRCIETLIPGKGRILDIGCSLGYFLEVASAKGWEPYGVDISSYAAEQVRKKGFDARACPLEKAEYSDGFFDCVTMWDTLEHVPDPSLHMREVGRILKDGGLVVIGTPNIGHPAFRFRQDGWRHLKPAEHLYYFNYSTIAKLLKKTGFRQTWPRLCKSASYVHFAAGFSQWMGRLLRANDMMLVYGFKTEQ